MMLLPSNNSPVFITTTDFRLPLAESDDDSEDEELMNVLPFTRKVRMARQKMTTQQQRTHLLSAMAIKMEIQQDTPTTVSPTSITPCQGKRHRKPTICDIDIRPDDEIRACVLPGAPRKPYLVLEKSINTFVANDATTQTTTTYLLRDATVPPHTISATCQVTQDWLFSPEADCDWWTYVDDTLESTRQTPEEVPQLHEAAQAARVRVQPMVYGYGLVAACDLNTGHCIPYGGHLTGAPRAQGVFNAEISTGIYIVADTLDERGPGAYCNDCTVAPAPQPDRPHLIRQTNQSANARLLCLEPYDDYVDDWGHGKNDGSEAVVVVELLRPVKEGEEVTVSYGEAYWAKGWGGGDCFSDPVTV